MISGMKQDSREFAAVPAIIGESLEAVRMGDAVGKKSGSESIDIGVIELDAKSRDDIPAILIGLQTIWMDETTRKELFQLLDARIPPERRRDRTRPETDLWRILVMGVLKRGLDCDFCHLQELVNNHMTIQAFLGHDVWLDPHDYELRNIRHNVRQLTPDLLRKVGEMVASTEHKVARKLPWRNIRRAQ